MKKKSWLAVVIAAFIMTFTACSNNTQQSEEDAALQQKLIGVWLYIDSAEYDGQGELTAFSAFQFTDKAVRCHDVKGARIESGFIDLYTIENGKFAAMENGKKQYAIIEIREVDGKDHLFWNIDSGGQEFIRMTDEEIADYAIPVDKLLSEEAELLGIETEPVQTGSEVISE